MTNLDLSPREVCWDHSVFMSKWNSTCLACGCSSGSWLLYTTGMSFCHHTARRESPGRIWHNQPEGGQGEPFLLSRSRSLALIQKRDQHLSCFKAAHQGSSALYYGRAAGTRTKRTCSSTPSIVSCKKRHSVLKTEASKPYLTTTTEMLERILRGRWGRHQTFGHT